MDEAFMQAYYRTYNSEDPEALAAFYDADVTLQSAAGTLHGAGAVLDTYRAIIADFEDRMTPQSMNFERGLARIGILDRFTARRDVEDFMGRSVAAGESFELQLVGTYRFKDGRISHIEIEQAG